MLIRKYSKVDEEPLFEMIAEEGGEWSEYCGAEGYARYARALEASLTYVVYEDDRLCGYVRCREDDGFGVYVYDLLVIKSQRGRQFGRLLMQRVCEDFPDQMVYVMSDVDAYYEKLGYGRVGSIFEVKR